MNQKSQKEKRGRRRLVYAPHFCVLALLFELQSSFIKQAVALCFLRMKCTQTHSDSHTHSQSVNPLHLSTAAGSFLLRFLEKARDFAPQPTLK